MTYTCATFSRLKLLTVSHCTLLSTLLGRLELGLEVAHGIGKARLGVVDLKALFLLGRVVVRAGPCLTDGNDGRVLLVRNELEGFWSGVLDTEDVSNGPTPRSRWQSRWKGRRQQSDKNICARRTTKTLSCDSQSIDNLARSHGDAGNVDTPATDTILEVFLGHAQAPDNVAEHRLGAREVDLHVVEDGVLGSRGDGAHALDTLEGFTDEA